MPGLPLKEAVLKVMRRKCLSAGGGEEGKDGATPGDGTRFAKDPGILPKSTQRESPMDHLEIIHHPRNRFSLTGSMAGLDAGGRDSADPRMTMIGDM
jgi:hypothetical protein